MQTTFYQCLHDFKNSFEYTCIHLQHTSVALVPATTTNFMVASNCTSSRCCAAWGAVWSVNTNSSKEVRNALYTFADFSWPLWRSGTLSRSNGAASRTLNSYIGDGIAADGSRCNCRKDQVVVPLQWPLSCRKVGNWSPCMRIGEAG